MEIPDLNSGFRAVKKDVAYEFIHLYPNGFSLTTTITMACIFSGYSIKYVSIDSLEREGKSKIKPISDGINFFTTYNTDDNVIQSVKSIFTSNVSIIFPGFHFVDT